MTRVLLAIGFGKKVLGILLKQLKAFNSINALGRSLENFVYVRILCASFHLCDLV